MVTNRNTTSKVSVKESLVQHLGSVLMSIKLVFSHWTYIAIAGTTATIFWIVFSVFEQLLFFSPIVVFYLPEDAIMGFIFSTITAILLGIVVSMNVYVFEHSRGKKLNAASLFSAFNQRSFQHMCKLFLPWHSTCIYIRWCRNNAFCLPIKLSNSIKNCISNTLAMGLLLDKQWFNKEL